MPLALCDSETDKYFFVEPSKWVVFERGRVGKCTSIFLMEFRYK